MSTDKIYGIADKAWQVVVGCSPSMPCAPRCWARRTVARIVECQAAHPRQEFFKIALSPDRSKWSGEVLLDEEHLEDPLHWRKPAIVATGFHGDWGRLGDEDKDRILAVMARAPRHRFLPLTKEPQRVARWLGHGTGKHRAALDNVNFGCSVMNQGEANKYRPWLRAIAEMGWATHCWYEPALGPVDWTGWEFLRGVIAGGESGAGARPSEAQWYRATRDWCVRRGIPYNHKQWGDYLPPGQVGAPGEGPGGGQMTWSADKPHPLRVHKRVAGRLLDGVAWDGVPEFGVRA